MKLLKYCLPIILVTLFLSGCSLIENEKPASASSITINMSGLVQLPDTNLSYVLWVTNPNGKVPLKLLVLKPDASGNISNLTFDVPSGKMQMAGEFWVTIQKSYLGTDSASYIVADSLNAVMSKVVVMTGHIAGNDASLSMSNANGDLTNVYMRYNLLTPTALSDSLQYSGIWFADTLNDANKPVTGTNIASVTGWVYRAVVEKDANNYLISEFTSAGASTSSNNYGEGMSRFTGGYVGKIIGGDFLIGETIFPLDLRNQKVAVYLLPLVSKLDGTRDSTNINFVFSKVFEGTVPANASTLTTYSLTNLNPALPRGTIKINLQI